MARESKEVAIARIMEGLHCSKEEAEDVYAYDKAVDKDQKTEYDLPPDKKKIAQKYAHTGIRTKAEKPPTAFNFPKKNTRKPNPTKEGIIAELAKFLAEQSEYAIENVNIANPSRLITFAIGETNFDLTLVQKKKKS